MATVAAKLPGSRFTSQSIPAACFHDLGTGQRLSTRISQERNPQTIWTSRPNTSGCGAFLMEIPAERTHLFEPSPKSASRHAPVSKLSTLCIGDPAAAENAFPFLSVVIQELSVGSTVMDFDEIQLGEGMSLPSEGLFRLERKPYDTRLLVAVQEAEHHSAGHWRNASTGSPSFRVSGLLLRVHHSASSWRFFVLSFPHGCRVEQGRGHDPSIWQTCDGRAPTLQVR